MPMPDTAELGHSLPLGSRAASYHLPPFDAGEASRPGPRPKPPAHPRLFGTDATMRRYLIGTLISCIPYSMGIVIDLYCLWAGYMSAEVATAMVIGRIATVAGLYAALRSGWSRRFQDPALSLFQVLIALAWLALTYALSGEAHATQFPILIMTMASATVNLRMPHARFSTFVGLLVMTASMGLMTHLRSDVYRPEVQLFLWVIMAASMPSMLFNGAQLKRIRKRLRVEGEELRQAMSRLNELATHDELTGLYNRAHISELLQDYLRRHRDEAEPAFCVALLDLDHFKQVNDSHGHAVGDDVLRAFADALRQHLRESDLSSRWGGEEFLLVFPQARADSALAGIDRLRAGFQHQAVSPSVPQLRATFSCGVAEVRNGEDLAALVDRADRALYVAKATGRNRSAMA